jgi:aerobic-type carbon monoxide dehydrogenase small subunit (CoxS/CutS family)
VAKVEITVNGTRHAREVEDRMLLANFLRDAVGLTRISAAIPVNAAAARST